MHRMSGHEPTDKKRRRFVSSRVFLLLLLGIFGFLLLANVRTYYRDYEVEAEIRELERQRESLSKKKLESMDILSYVMSDRFVEDTARTSLDMQSPGEKVAVIVVPEDERMNVGRPNRTTEPDDPFANPKKWWYYFSEPKSL